MADAPPRPLVSDREIVGYLLSRGCIDTSDIVMDGLTITRHARRNINVAVRTKRRAVFLKQADPQQHTATLGREAEVYGVFSTAPSMNGRQVAPAFLWFDPERQILAIACLDGMTAPTAAPVAIWAEPFAEALARQLVWVHRAGEACDTRLVAPISASAHFGRIGLATYARSSQAALDVLRVVQGSPLLVDNLAEAPCPNADTTLIHGDMRWDNLMVSSEVQASALPDLLIVDWELAGRGDPARDLGAIFAEFLLSWIRAVPVCDDLALEDAVDLAAASLDACYRQTPRFWEVYRSLSSGRRGDGLLRRSIVACGRRLVQSAFEQAQSAAKIPGASILMLQLAENLMSDPERGARMLGLAPE